MSYKALLFCPDDKTARVVTQVLSELEFDVERSGQPFATVRKLTDQHFDALVVDCQNEQDASLLFKGARNSSSNHSSLAVAVVEGQAGVAQAFRIGANLVLTKPINIEQSKNTLRVARGLLRKNEAKAAGAPAATRAMTAAAGSQSAATSSLPLRISPSPPPQASPFSALEREEESVPAPDASEAAVLESLRDPINSATTNEQSWAPALRSSAEPIAASTSGQSGAAAAPALAKIEIKTAPPLATHESIVTKQNMPAAMDRAEIPAPTFSSYGEAATEGGSGKNILALVVAIAIAAALAYVGLRRPDLFQNLHHSSSAQPAKTPADSAAPAITEPLTRAERKSSVEFPSSTTESMASTAAPAYSSSGTPPEIIQVDPEASTPEPKITVVPKPLVVKVKPSTAVEQKLERSAPAPTPPTLNVSGQDASANTLAGLVTANTVLPKVAPGSIRVSQGVSQGLLVKRVTPAYPALALQSRKQGVVELLATINKNGDIKGVRVLSGEPTLARSAADAVRQWKYRPYLLNGEPVEIETQITVNFKLPH